MKNTDEVNALKVIQMYEIKILTKQPAFKIENVVTNKNFIFELLLGGDMWPIGHAYF